MVGPCRDGLLHGLPIEERIIVLRQKLEFGFIFRIAVYAPTTELQFWRIEC